MPDLGNHVAVVHIPAWITLANEGLGIRVKPQCSRTHYPRLEQHIGILYRDFIAQSVSFPAQFLDDVHVVGMKISASIEPREIVEPDGVDDQRIAFPAADGISIKGHVLGFHGIVIAPIGRNNSKVIGLRSGSGRMRAKRTSRVPNIFIVDTSTMMEPWLSWRSRGARYRMTLVSPS